MLYFSTSEAQGRNAQSKYYVEISLFPGNSITNDIRNLDNTTVGTAAEYLPTTDFAVDTRNTFAYVFGGQYLLGFSYNYYTQTFKRDASASDSSRDDKITTQVYGPTVGVLSGNWRFLFTYFMGGSHEFSEYAEDINGTVTFEAVHSSSQVTGTQFHIGYSFPISTKMEFGAALIYKDIAFKKQARTGTGAFPEQEVPAGQQTKLGGWDPMISMIFRF